MNFRKGLCWKLCKYKEWISFFWDHGGMNHSAKQIVWELLCGSCDLFVPHSDSFPMNSEKRHFFLDWFWSRGQKSRSFLALYLKNLIGTMQITVFIKSLKLHIRLFMMREGVLLVFGHKVKGQGQLCYSTFKTYRHNTDYRFCPTT